MLRRTQRKMKLSILKLCLWLATAAVILALCGCDMTFQTTVPTVSHSTTAEEPHTHAPHEDTAEGTTADAPEDRPTPPETDPDGDKTQPPHED